MEDIWANEDRYIYICQISLKRYTVFFIKGAQIETTMGHHHTPNRMAEMEKMTILSASRYADPQ